MICIFRELYIQFNYNLFEKRIPLTIFQNFAMRSPNHGKKVSSHFWYFLVIQRIIICTIGAYSVYRYNTSNTYNASFFLSLLLSPFSPPSSLSPTILRIFLFNRVSKISSMSYLRTLFFLVSLCDVYFSSFWIFPILCKQWLFGFWAALWVSFEFALCFGPIITAVLDHEISKDCRSVFDLWNRNHFSQIAYTSFYTF